jgi:hypothetical protein
MGILDSSSFSNPEKTQGERGTETKKDYGERGRGRAREEKMQNKKK